MTEELQLVEKFRSTFQENKYRFLVARIAIFHLKDQAKNKADLHRKVNIFLLSQNLKPVSRGFIKTNL